MTSYYDVLGVSIDAEPDEVRRAYYRKAQLLHPDRNSGAEAEMKLVNEAWNTLRNPEARRRYDTTLVPIQVEVVASEVRPEPLPTPRRRAGARWVIALVLIAGILTSAVVLSQQGDRPAPWSATATAKLRSAAIGAGMTETQADCFVDAITRRYGPSDDIDRAAVQQLMIACR